MKIAAYAPPTTAYRIDLKLDANEGRRAPREALEAAALAALDDVHLYPSVADLQERLALRLGATPAQVVVGAGGDDVLFRVCRAFLGTERRAIVTSPTFEMIPREAKATGATVDEVEWWDGPFPLQQIIARVSPETGVIFVVTPNNPTGNVASLEDVQRLSAAAPHAVVCVDLAYTEYADVDLTPEVLRLPNVVVVRTMSKAWGLAGLRVGYGVGGAGSQHLMQDVRGAGGPFPTSALSLAVASRWLETGESFVRESVRLTRAERATLGTLLRSRGVGVIDSQANFVLARFGSGAAAWGVADALARDHGIGVRRFPAETELGGSLRITCPCDADAFDRLTRAMVDVLGGTR